MQRLPPPLTRLDSPFVLPDVHSEVPRAGGSLPRLTVITPSYNQGAYLEATIRSVLAQGYPELEYLVVDGGSQDQSEAIIRHYAEHLAWWIVEKDRGQADAIAKGLARAQGEWFVWINSDDLLAPGALWKVAAAASADVDVIAGTTQYFSGTQATGQQPCRNFNARAIILEQLGSGLKWHQPGVWLRREPAAAIGLNPALHHAFDYDLMIRYLQRHPRVRYLDDVLAWFRYHDSSKTVSQGGRFRVEQVGILRQLAREIEFAPLGADLDRAARAVDWLRQVDDWLDDRATPRLARLRALIQGTRADPPARCTPNTRRAARRLLRYGGRKP